MRKTTKTLLTAGLTLGLVMTTLTGCSPSATAPVLRAGGQSLNFGEVNFYARYYQSEYEQYAQMFGSTPDVMWETFVDEELTQEDQVKDSIKNTLEEMLLLEMNAEEYGVTLSDEEKQKISDTADEFLAANTEETLNVMTADKDTVTHVLEMMTIQYKMQEALVQDVDENVSDEEALQKSMSYVSIGAAETFNMDEDDASSDVMDALQDVMSTGSEETAAALADAVKEAKSQEEFESIVSDAGFSAMTVSYDATDVLEPNAALCEAMWDLKAGEVSGAVSDEESGAYFIGYQISEKDDEATQSRKEAIVNERKQDAYDSKLEEMRTAAHVSWKEGRWDKISFIKQGCLFVTPEAEAEDTEEAYPDEAPAAKLLTDSSLSVAEGDNVSISYVGTMDGVAFDGGTGESDLVIGSGAFIPGFEDQLIGAHPGDTVEVNVTFPEDYHAEELAGQDAVFTVDILGIYEN